MVYGELLRVEEERIKEERIKEERGKSRRGKSEIPIAIGRKSRRGKD
jgi:hypothetical protein